MFVETFDKAEGCRRLRADIWIHSLLLNSLLQPLFQGISTNFILSLQSIDFLLPHCRDISAFYIPAEQHDILSPLPPLSPIGSKRFLFLFSSFSATLQASTSVIKGVLMKPKWHSLKGYHQNHLDEHFAVGGRKKPGEAMRMSALPGKEKDWTQH